MTSHSALDDREFENEVDAHVLRALPHLSGQKESLFEELLWALPGVYPITALDSLRRLVENGRVDQSVLAATLEEARRSSKPTAEPAYSRRNRLELPIPHPLDYDWRWDDATLQFLLKMCSSLATSDDEVVLLGTPGLLRAAIEWKFARSITLLEANPLVVARFAGVELSARVVRCDLEQDALPSLCGGVIVADPPWYEEATRSFLWVAHQMCRLGGHVLLGVPPLGTRPSIKEERVRLLDRARTLGLTCEQILPASLVYVTPPFERNSLCVQGLDAVPATWRRGDLLVFRCERRADVPRPVAMIREDWTEQVFDSVRVRIRHQEHTSNTSSAETALGDPALISLVPYDILPSVSRREPVRELVDVWTSGNRVFKCRDCRTLSEIGQALAQGHSPFENITIRLGRTLTDHEIHLVSAAASQLAELVRIELQEHEEYAERHVAN